MSPQTCTCVLKADFGLQAAVALVGDSQIPLEDRLIAWDELEMLIESYVSAPLAVHILNAFQARQCE